jgi:hypothetical protein
MSQFHLETFTLPTDDMGALAVRELLPLCSDQGDFQLDFEIVANQESSGFKRRVPRETEIAPLDPCGCRGTYPGIPHGHWKLELVEQIKQIQ